MFLNIDWGVVLMPALQTLLSVLATALTGYFIILARSEWVKLELNRPDIVDKIQEAAQFSRPVVDQLKKSGVIPSNEDAKTYAEKLVNDYLKAKGVTADLTIYENLISASIEKAIDDNRNTVTTATSTVTKVEPSPSKVFAPVNTLLGDSNIANQIVAEVPSVVTTTTNSVVSAPVVDEVNEVIGTVG